MKVKIGVKVVFAMIIWTHKTQYKVIGVMSEPAYISQVHHTCIPC